MFRISITFLLLNLLMFQSSFAQLCFNPNINFGNVSQSLGVFSHDFNGDGNLDFVASQNSNGLLSLYSGDGIGNFNLSQDFQLSGNAVEIIGGDFNEDGKIDLATSGGGSNVWILIADNMGGFGSAISYSAGLYPSSLISGDFNNDNHLDLAVSNGNSANTISILIGNGSGSFNSPVNYPVGICPCGISCIKSYDVNSDGNLDLIVANQASNNVSILIGNGLGSFNNPINYNVGSFPWSVEIADLNGDSFIDIVTSNQNSNNVSVLIGNSSGIFSNSVNYSVGNLPEQLKLVDFDLDGIKDIATTDKGSNQISVLKGIGNGSFSSSFTYAVDQGPFALSTGDFNNDGSFDILCSNLFSSNFSLLLNCVCTLAITTQPINQVVNLSGGNTSFNVATNATNPTYQWQTNVGVGFQNLSNAGQYSGVNTANLIVSNLTLTNDNQSFRCLISDGGCVDTSDIANLSIVNDASILTQQETSIFLSPNPITQSFSISGITNIVSLSLKDMSGKTVKSFDVIEKNYSASNVSSGVYFLEVRDENRSYIIKVVKD